MYSECVTHLTFGDNFNQPICIPDSVTHLTFGYCFYQLIKDAFQIVLHI